MPATLFSNVRLFDGTGSGPYPGEVLVDDNRIRKVARGDAHIDASGAQIVNGAGAVLMPGLTDGHAHLAFPYSANRPPLEGYNIYDFLQLRVPMEHYSFRTVSNAKLLLDSGITSVYSAGGSTPIMDIALREEINNGHLPGPRIRACGMEGVANELNGTATKETSGLSRNSDIENTRQFVKDCAAKGADVVKFVLSGPAASGPDDCMSMYSDEALAAAKCAAEEADVWLSGHCRPAETIKQGLTFGFRVLYHCDFMNEELFDLAEARKDRLFVGPSVANMAKSMIPGSEFVPEAKLQEQYTKNLAEFRKRGIRIVIGGDYGLRPGAPHGHNARDLHYLVKFFGVSPTEALVAGTKTGGELMDMGHELGLIREGYLADLLLVDGDPVADISLLSNSDNLIMIMKDGRFHKTPPASRMLRPQAA